MVGISPIDDSNTLLVDALLLEQDEQWHLEGWRIFSAYSMAAILALKAGAGAGIAAGSNGVSSGRRRSRRSAPTRRCAGDQRLGTGTHSGTTKIAGVAQNQSAIQTKDLTSHLSGFSVKQRG